MPPSPIPDALLEQQLVDQMRKGDRAALGRLLEAHSRRVYHVCLRMVGQAEDAADLTQETLLRAVRHAEEFQGNSRFGTWLIRIAMNLSVSHLRKSSLRQAASLEQPVGAPAGHAAPMGSLVASDREQPPGQSVETKEEIQKLTRAIESLELSLRSVIILRDLQQMDYQQIAEILALPIGTVKSRLFRARLSLRQLMEGYPS